MHFGGLSKLYHVFIGELGADLKPQASNEIARCKLFRHDTIAELRASIPTKKIIELAYRGNRLFCACMAVSLEISRKIMGLA